MADRATPTATYRLQLHAGFGFAEAAAVVPYLDRLGVSHLYLSPILQAAPGSMHGYDVVDHSRVSEPLGGEDGLLALADTAHGHGLGIVVDVVPNHMAIPVPERLNRQLWSTLRLGRSGPDAHWFDIDWAAGDDRLLLPILDGSLAELPSCTAITLERDGDGEGLLRYGGHELPLAPGSLRDSLEETLALQHYRLVASAAGERPPGRINYRRFFDVDSLIAVRVELDDVFEATHAVLLDLRRRGVIDGLRIDHPDGLHDPQAYLSRLGSESGGAWVVVEKILEPGETLPAGWECDGTTGYDAARAVTAALVPDVAAELTTRWVGAGGEASYELVEQESRRKVIATLFGPEVERLVRLSVSAAAHHGDALDGPTARGVVIELLAQIEVYRAYARPGAELPARTAVLLAELVARARNAQPDLAGGLGIVHRLLADTMSTDPATRDLVVRFQQVCGPVMAKGVEDTAYYRWLRMIALNEVGGDPRALERASTDRLHEWAEEQAASRPSGMTTLSTHDTKRSEDVRARLLAAAEDLDSWDEVADAVWAEAVRSDVDAPTAYLIAQTLIGGWPLAPERLHAYLEKAIREAKRATSWQHPDLGYEQRVHRLADSCLSGPVSDTVRRAVEASAEATRAITLGGKLLQLCLPGVPDVYQGTEIVERTLVDPDNRRPVDFSRRESLLAQLDSHRLDAHGVDGAGVDGAVVDGAGVDGAGVDGPGLDSHRVDAGRLPSASPADAGLDADKLALTSRVLRLRRSHPELFARSSYRPLRSRSPHLLGFLRGDRLAVLAIRWPGRLRSTGWGDARVELPPGRWHDVLADSRLDVGDARVRCADVLDRLPVALLVRSDG